LTAKSRINPWVFVWLCFATLGVVMSARQSVSIMTDEWARTLGWSKSFIGSGQAIAMVVMALAGPITGNLADRHGVRALLSCGLVVVAAGLLLFAAFPSAALYIIGYGFVAGAGFGAVRSHLVSTAVAKSFTEKRGLALGIANAGTSAGQFFTVPLLTMALSYFSWRWGIAAAAATCLLMAALIWSALQPSREDAATPARPAPTEPLGDRLRFLFANRTFHLLFWSFFICGATTTGAVETHFLPYAAYCGFPPVPASGIYGVTMAINLGGMILAGYLTDRMSRPILLCVIYLMRAVSFVVLLFVGTSYEMMLLFTLIFGLFDYSTVPPTASLVASHLGIKVMGLAMGLITGGHALGGALGAFAGGFLFDLFARYSEMWWLTFASATLAGLLVLLLKDGRMAGGPAPGHA
jgi:predicted MFS family arabinose efflux permease